MTHFIISLADIDPSELLNAEKEFAGSRFYEIALLGGSMFVVIVIASIGAILYSKRKKHRKHRHHRHRKESPNMAMENGESSKTHSEERSSKGGKRKRRSQRPMNPTLEQTHGLPPMRDPNTLPPVP